MEDDDIRGREVVNCLQHEPSVSARTAKLLMPCVPWSVLDTMTSGGKEEHKVRS